MKIENEDIILEAAKSGDEAAIISLINHYQPDLKKFASIVCQTSEDAEDAVQHTLFIISTKLGMFKQASRFSSWLFAIVKNECLKLLRNLKKHSELSDTHADFASSAEERFSDEELLAKVKDAFLKLEPIYREVFILRDVEGMPAHQVSQQLGISVSAVKSRLHRARDEVRSMLR